MDYSKGCFIGRIWDNSKNGPCLIRIKDGNVYDITSKEIPTVRDLLELEDIKKYLNNGGFLHIDDNYGMDKFIRRKLKKVFPKQKLIELPFSHPIFHQKFDFPNGLPKIHEHDNKPPQAFGLFHESKLVVLYTYESDLGDGWEDAEVHNNDKETRTKALEMGSNIIQFAFNLGDKKSN